MSTQRSEPSRTETHADLVRAAVGGDKGAFDELVRRFQDLAVGTARAWLRDPGQAEDAAQEAFVEVYRQLDRLKEPAAFPGFLRRIVLKHCDRRTRGRRHEVALAEAPRTGAAASGDGEESAPDALLIEADERARVRAALEALPPADRLVVALHYLGGLAQSEVATWLELPLSTVKKRLHDARVRLRASLETRMHAAFEARPPSLGTRFSDTIRLFLAIREGDVQTVRDLLARDPGLVEVEERWEDETTRAHQLPVPNGGTPLVRAAQRGELAVIDVLLEHGADVDRSCTCPGGESPLWAAVASGQLEAARRLLARGADPDRLSFADHTPLHVAALRGFDEIAMLLCAHGADRRLRDRHRRTPADWARRNGHVRLAEQLAERAPIAAEAGDPVGAADAAGRPGPAVAPLAIAAVETGIKAIDLLAPLGPGSRTRMRFDAGQGAIVLLAELSLRWARQHAAPGGTAVIWVGWERLPSDQSELHHAFAELGLGGCARLVFSPAHDAEDERQRTLPRAIAEARALQACGVASPLLVVFAQHGRRAEIESALPALADGQARSLSAIVAERQGDHDDPPDESGPVRPPFDGRLAFDPSLAAQGWFPALHPLASGTSCRLPGRTGDRHECVAARARGLLEELRRLAPAPGAPSDSIGAQERATIARARRLQAFLTQPFFATESFSGLPGCHVSLDDTLDGVEAILDGALDGIALGCVRYRGALADVLAASAAGGAPQTRA